jgi:hypothetical protein
MHFVQCFAKLIGFEMILSYIVLDKKTSQMLLFQLPKIADRQLLPLSIYSVYTHSFVILAWTLDFVTNLIFFYQEEEYTEGEIFQVQNRT